MSASHEKINRYVSMLCVNVSVIDICDTVIDLDRMSNTIFYSIIGVLFSISLRSSAVTIEVNLRDLENANFLGDMTNDRPIIGKCVGFFLKKNLGN